MFLFAGGLIFDRLLFVINLNALIHEGKSVETLLNKRVVHPDVFFCFMLWKRNMGFLWKRSCQISDIYYVPIFQNTADSCYIYIG